MNNQDYNCTFTVKNTPHEVFESICLVSKWWTVNTEGSSKNLNDVFTVRFNETYVTFKITEMTPDKKIVWHITDCFLHWLKDKTEWKNTELNFEISATKDGTQMSMTHMGIVPGIECYENCKKGWDFFAGESLLKLISEKKGQPDRNKSLT